MNVVVRLCTGTQVYRDEKFFGMEKGGGRRGGEKQTCKEDVFFFKRGGLFTGGAEI